MKDAQALIVPWKIAFSEQIGLYGAIKTDIDEDCFFILRCTFGITSNQQGLVVLIQANIGEMYGFGWRFEQRFLPNNGLVFSIVFQ